MEAYRAVLEVRYEPIPRYLDTRGAILEEFKSKYPQIQVEDLPIGPPLGDLGKHVRLKNEQRGIKAFVNGIHTGFEMRFEPFDLDVFAREAERFCRTVVRDILRVDAVTRLGMRFWYRWGMLDGDLSNYMFHKLLSLKDDMHEVQLKGVNFRLRFSAADGDFRYTFQFYPEREAEGEEPQNTGFCTADFDVYQQDLPVTAALTSSRNTIQEAQMRSLEKGTRLLEGIFDNG